MIVSPLIDPGLMSTVQLPVRPPTPLNVTRSPGPGTDAPPGPPEVVDQLAVLLQLPGEVAIQKRCERAEFSEKMTKKRDKSQVDFFFKAVQF